MGRGTSAFVKIFLVSDLDSLSKFSFSFFFFFFFAFLHIFWDVDDYCFILFYLFTTVFFDLSAR